jgi:hypothetical protein
MCHCWELRLQVVVLLAQRSFQADVDEQRGCSPGVVLQRTKDVVLLLLQRVSPRWQFFYECFCLKLIDSLHPLVTGPEWMDLVDFEHFVQWK